MFGMDDSMHSLISTVLGKGTHYWSGSVLGNDIRSWSSTVLGNEREREF